MKETDLIKRFLELKSKATDLVVQIDDGYLYGKCDFESRLRFF